MSNAMPYVKWHGRDWLGDPLLRMVKPEVRGIWIDLLCAMMEATPYGHLAVAGKAMNDEQAARLTGVDIETYKGCLKVIEDAGISSRTNEGLLYSRRLVREHDRFLQASEYGKKGGGNPALKNKKIKKARSQKPEAKGTIKGGYKGTYKGSLNATEQGLFDRFWSEYPRKEGKKNAEKAWYFATDKPDIETIIKAVEAQKTTDQWQKDGGQYIPMPTTWLNQGRWDDVVKVAPVPWYKRPKGEENAE